MGHCDSGARAEPVFMLIAAVWIRGCTAEPSLEVMIDLIRLFIELNSSRMLPVHLLEMRWHSFAQVLAFVLLKPWNQDILHFNANVL